MHKISDKRKWPRRTLTPPFLGALCPSATAGIGTEAHQSFFVDILNLSESGALIGSGNNIGEHFAWALLSIDPASNEWRFFNTRIIWTGTGSNDHCHVGLEFMDSRRIEGDAFDGHWPAPDGIEFLTEMLLMDWVPRHAFCDLLNCFRMERFSAGYRVIRQGEPGDYLYIVQEGVCSVSVEKEGGTHQVGRIHKGEIFGEMAIITGEPRSAHVDTETDVIAWKLSKDDFERVADKYPELRGFLTELVANRFESSVVTADRVIGKYVIKRKIGKGGWSIVYKGVHESLGFPVAIKMMRHDMASEPNFADRFRTEAQLIAGMSHRNIVHIYDIEERYRTIFIIMEYLEGHLLESILNQTGRLPVTRVMNLLIQACMAIGYAHQSGIIHQDIKPGNIFVLPGDRIKVLDFGLACCSGSEDLCFLGTIQYTAPEQILGDPVGPYTDMYALGMTTYELLTGTRPYPEDDFNALLDMHLNIDIPDPGELVPDLPEPLRKFIVKACKRNIDDRYPNTDEALKDLIPLAHSLGCYADSDTPAMRKLTTLLLSYSEEQSLELKKLLEKFSLELRDLGIAMKSADFDNL